MSSATPGRESLFSDAQVYNDGGWPNPVGGPCIHCGKVYDAHCRDNLECPVASTPPELLFPLRGFSLSVTVEDGCYVKAYANPPQGGGIVSYGLQGRMREEVADGIRQLVEQWIEANREAASE